MPSNVAERPRVRYEPRGAAATALVDHSPELMLAGPAGTGKSRACLEKVNALAVRYRGSRHLLLRKTLTSLTASGLVTFEQKVRPEIHGATFFGGNAHTPAHYRYPNGSSVAVGGLDRPTRVLSTEYDAAYIQEATELTEEEWELVGSRLRNGVLPFQQLVGDCNPDAPTSWVLARAGRGVLRLLDSRHEDNPLYWDHRAGDWTPAGRDYVLGRLEALTGVRYKRLRLGQWVAAEGQVYEEWDRALHLVDRFPIPPAWPRYLAIDFGYTNPFVCQWWAEDPDGRLYRYRELYHTRRLVEDHATAIRAACAGEPRPRAIICDHDAEDRATLERHLGWTTTPAHKAVSPGIQAVAARLRRAGDGRPRLFLLRDALLGRDSEREAARQPCCTEEEIEAYVWDTSANRRRGEEPLKRDDHGCDAMRYMVAHRDLRSPGGNLRYL